MKRRHTLAALLAAACGTPLTSFAQANNAMRRIGVTAAGSAPSLAVEVLRKRLAELGWVEGRNLQMDVRYSDGDTTRYAGFMADFVKQKVDLIVSGGGVVRVAMDATSTIPIVMPLSSDPVANKFVTSLARPGGNVTGMSIVDTELNGKRIEMLRELLPAAKRLAVLHEGVSSSSSHRLDVVHAAAKVKGFQVQVVSALRAEEFVGIFEALAKSQTEALLVLPSSVFNVGRSQLVQLAAQVRLPAIYEHAAFTDAGGLISYGANFLNMYRQSAYFVDKILRGAKPADLPVQQPTRYDLVLNLKTAKALGLKFPQTLMVRADKVIE